jgi:hypothetical protein
MGGGRRFRRRLVKTTMRFSRSFRVGSFGLGLGLVDGKIGVLDEDGLKSVVCILDFSCILVA